MARIVLILFMVCAGCAHDGIIMSQEEWLERCGPYVGTQYDCMKSPGLISITFPDGDVIWLPSEKVREVDAFQ